MHVIHAIEVLAYRCPDTAARDYWMQLYVSACVSLHMNPESFAQYVERLSEDRIAKGNVVS